MDKILKLFGELKLREAVEKSKSFSEVLIYLGLDQFETKVRKNVSRSINSLGISTKHFKYKIIESKFFNNFNDEKKDILTSIVNTSETYPEVLQKIGETNLDQLKSYLYRYNINYEHLKNKRMIGNKVSVWTEEILRKVVSESKTQKEVIDKMKLRSAGSNFYTLKKYLKIYNIDTSHFIKSYDKLLVLRFESKITLEDVLVEKSNYNRSNLKKKLYESGLKERKCELCGQNENWNGKKMSLILDHINGVHDDNRIENLRIVCPNCNATLDTHCSKNIKKKQRLEKKIKTKKIRTGQSEMEFHISRRIVERPPYDILKNEVNLFGLEGVGRKYGVTGNAIKKWLKTYEKYGK